LWAVLLLTFIDQPAVVAYAKIPVGFSGSVQIRLHDRAPQQPFAA
jgi:hypothetical protein